MKAYLARCGSHIMGGKGKTNIHVKVWIIHDKIVWEQTGWCDSELVVIQLLIKSGISKWTSDIKHNFNMILNTTSFNAWEFNPKWEEDSLLLTRGGGRSALLYEELCSVTKSMKAWQWQHDPSTTTLREREVVVVSSILIRRWCYLTWEKENLSTLIVGGRQRSHRRKKEVGTRKLEEME